MNNSMKQSKIKSKQLTKPNLVYLVADIYDHAKHLHKDHIQEWESLDSVIYLKNTIESIGYKCEIIEPFVQPELLLKKIQSHFKQNTNCPIIFNLVEGFQSRNREAWISAIAEMYGLYYTGSDAFSQCVSLNKELTKLIARSLHITTPRSFLIRDMNEIRNIKYPVFLKPNSEGSSLGIESDSIAHNFNSFTKKMIQLLKKYDEVLVEDYVDGIELTVGVIGNYPNYQCSEVARIEYNDKVYGQKIKTKAKMPEKLFFDIDSRVANRVKHATIKLCTKIKINGYGRLDFILDQKKKLQFLEINLTPGLSYKYSTFPLIFQQANLLYKDQIEKILELAIERNPIKYGLNFSMHTSHARKDRIKFID